MCSPVPYIDSDVKIVHQVGFEPTTYCFIPLYVTIAKQTWYQLHQVSQSLQLTPYMDLNHWLLFVVVWNTLLPYWNSCKCSYFTLFKVNITFLFCTLTRFSSKNNFNLGILIRHIWIECEGIQCISLISPIYSLHIYEKIAAICATLLFSCVCYY